MKADILKQRLASLGASTLAEHLVQLADSHGQIHDYLMRLVASPEDLFASVSDRIHSLKDFVFDLPWNSESELTEELEEILKDLEALPDTCFQAADLVIDFFKTDTFVAEHIHHSYSIESAYSDAASHLVRFGRAYPDKRYLADAVLELLISDEYGMREEIAHRAAEFLPQDEVRRLVGMFRQPGSHRSHHTAAMMAKSLGDTALMEEIQITSTGQIPDNVLLDIAEVHLANNDAPAALAYLQGIPETSNCSYDRTSMLKTAYRMVEDWNSLEMILRNELRSFPTIDRLDALVDVIGEDRRQDTIDTERDAILTGRNLSTYGVQFLIDTGHIFEAGEYILSRQNQLQGSFYSELLPIAEALVKASCELAASCIYRSLLTDILDRGCSKAYHHGVDYLNALDSLASVITDWKGVEDHTAYKARLIEKHKRKYSFWQQYPTEPTA